MVKQLTRGKPLPLILGFCLPMLLGNVFQQFYSMADTVIVGKTLGVNALGAVGSTGAINFLIIGFVMGITSGCCILPAQAFGAGNVSEMRKLVANMVFICIGTTVVVTTASMIFTMPLLELMQTPPEIIQMAYDYIIVIFGGIGVTMMYNALAGILRALGDSKTPLYFLILSSVVNVILDFAFILGLGMGVAGAGWATVISQGVSAVLCLVYIYRSYEILHFQKDEFRFSGERCLKLIKIGLPMALQFSITAIGSIILQVAVNGLGTVYVAAGTAVGKLQGLIVQPMETLGITMATYCGQNLGAGEIPRIRDGIKKSLIAALIYSVVALLAMWFFGGSACLLFVDAEETEVLKNALHFMRINSMFYPVLAVLFVLRNSLQGLGYSLLPMSAGICELAARTFISLCLVGVFGYDAVCFAAPTAWCAADILLIATYVVKIRGLSHNYEKKLRET